MSRTTDAIATAKQYLMQTYHGQFPIVFASGKGAVYTDVEGKEYVDFASGIGVNALGACDDGWVKAVSGQAATLGHVSNLYFHEPEIRLAKELVTRAGMQNVFFGNSGTEGNEGLIKMARKYSFDKYGAGRSTIVTLKNSFHGRTMASLTATGQDVFHNYFFPFVEGFRYAEANDLADVQAKVGDDTCAILLEMIQGEGGVNVLDKAFVQAVAALCAEKDILLLVDEVQTGVGRTGTLFAYQQYGIEPDGVSFAKGIAGGLPMGGFMAGKKTASVMDGQHGSTFGANPICCAAAETVLAAITPALLEQVREQGDYLRGQIAAMGCEKIEHIRGLGLMVGMTLKEGCGMTVGEAVTKLAEAGLLVLSAQNNTIRLLPPLTITKAEIDRGLEIFKAVLCG